MNWSRNWSHLTHWIHRGSSTPTRLWELIPKFLLDPKQTLGPLQVCGLPSGPEEDSQEFGIGNYGQFRRFRPTLDPSGAAPRTPSDLTVIPKIHTGPILTGSIVIWARVTILVHRLSPKFLQVPFRSNSLHSTPDGTCLGPGLSLVLREFIPLLQVIYNGSVSLSPRLESQRLLSCEFWIILGSLRSPTLGAVHQDPKPRPKTHFRHILDPHSTNWTCVGTFYPSASLALTPSGPLDPSPVHHTWLASTTTAPSLPSRR